MLLNLGIKFLIIPIFVEILDPPIIQVIGFLISDVTFFKALTNRLRGPPHAINWILRPRN